MRSMEGLYTQWRSDPESVDPSWRHFFQGMEFALERPENGVLFGKPLAKSIF